MVASAKRFYREKFCSFSSDLYAVHFQAVSVLFSATVLLALCVVGKFSEKESFEQLCLIPIRPMLQRSIKNFSWLNVSLLCSIKKILTAGSHKKGWD